MQRGWVLALWMGAQAAGGGLPHVEQVAAGVWAAGFADRYGSANCGWFVEGNRTVLVDVPYGVSAEEYLAEVAKRSGRRAGTLLRTETVERPIVAELLRLGVAPAGTVPGVEAIGLEGKSKALYLRKQGVLFAGPAVVNGPRAVLAGRDTRAWIADLGRLEALGARRVVPGRGSWGMPSMIGRQKRFLEELRRQVAYAITMGRPLEVIQREVLLPASYYTWMPYDNPRREDIQHVYGELMAPPRWESPRPRALVLIGDRYHEPEHIEAGLEPAFRATGVSPQYVVNVAELNARNLKEADLLVVLRDGMLWPDGVEKPYKIWMTAEQERAVVDFVEGGGGFLNLHNSMGLYPENGPYLNLVGGRYIGHGPLERFRVEVADAGHPVTAGAREWFSADEQHTPPCDETKVKVLLRNRSDDGKTAAAGWAYEPGKGRLVHLASGHTRESLEHPVFQLLLKNSIRWLLRR